MFTVSNDLVLYGGDKSGLAVCTMAGADWKWASPAITGNPLHCQAHALMAFLNLSDLEAVKFYGCICQTCLTKLLHSCFICLLCMRWSHVWN